MERDRRGEILELVENLLAERIERARKLGAEEASQEIAGQVAAIVAMAARVLAQVRVALVAEMPVQGAEGAH